MSFAVSPSRPASRSPRARAALLVSAALPLVLGAPAFAAEVNGATTTPLATATADSGGPGDILVNTGGSITLTTAGPILTLNSNNSINNTGVLTINNVTGATGVLIQGGVTGQFVNNSNIILTEDYLRTDTDNDGDFDGPVASGSGRTAVLAQGPGIFTGNIINAATSSVVVEGNDSAGVRVTTGVTGDVRSHGLLQVLGSNSVGVDIRAAVGGLVETGGTIGVVGENSRGVVIAADSAGYQNTAAINVTGYTAINVSNYYDPDDVPAGFAPLVLDADDLLQSGAAVSIGGDLTNGFYNSGLFGDAAVDDVDGADPTGKNIRQDYNPNRSTAQINSYGGAPAVLISPDVNPAGDSIQIGLAREFVRDTLDDNGNGDRMEILATFQEDYGFVNRGSIAGVGLNAGIAAQGVVITGSTTGPRTVTIQGGILNVGAISSAAREANATTFRIGNLVDAGRFNNAATLATEVATETQHTARTLVIDSGATLSELLNSGTISANVRGDEGSAIAVQDRSGTLLSVVNDGVISAGYFADEDDDDGDGFIGDTDEITGSTVALDLSAATGNISVVQGASGTGGPQIIGDILLGAGNDVLDIRRGFVGADTISFGAGADTLRMSGAETVVIGNIVDVGGDLSIQASGGRLTVLNTAPLQIGAGDFGADSVLELTVGGTASDRVLTVSGVAHFADGAEIRARLQNLLLETRDFVLVGAGDLQIDGALASLVAADSAFLYQQSASLRTVGAEEQLVLSMRRKTPAELGMNANQAAAFAPALEALSADPVLTAEFGSLTTQEDFFFAYDQLLPDFSGATVQLVAAGMQSAAGLISDRIDTVVRTPGRRGAGYWAQEYYYYLNRDSVTAGSAFSGNGLGGAAGFDAPLGPFDAVGLNFTVSSGEFSQIGGFDQPSQVTSIGGGLYAGGESGGLTYSASVGAAYDDFESERRVITDTLDRRAMGDWSGYQINASAQIGYVIDAGFIQIRPRASVDYIQVSENAYAETGGGQGVDLVVEDRTSDMTSVTGVIELTHLFGDEEGWWAPTLRAGVRTNSGQLGATVVRFAGMNSTFQVQAEDMPGTALIGGFNVAGGNTIAAFRIGYDTDVEKDFVRHVGRASVRLAF